MNNYILKKYKNNEIYKGLIVPEVGQNSLNLCPLCGELKSCRDLNCVRDCIFGNEKILKQYLKLKERKEKIKCLNLVTK